MHITRLANLPFQGLAHELEGRLHGGVEVSIIIVEAPPGEGPALHVHPYPEVLLVQAGRARCIVGSEEREVGAGDIVVIGAGEPHAFTSIGPEPLRQIDIHLSATFITEWLTPGKVAPPAEPSAAT